MKKIYQIKQRVTPKGYVAGEASVETEDGGMAKIADFSDASGDGMFVRVQSWNNHTDFDKMLGKLVQVTVEIDDGPAPGVPSLADDYDGEEYVCEVRYVLEETYAHVEDDEITFYCLDHAPAGVDMLPRSQMQAVVDTLQDAKREMPKCDHCDHTLVEQV